jgi:hypothetical protein
MGEGGSGVGRARPEEEVKRAIEGSGKDFGKSIDKCEQCGPYNIVQSC